MEISRWLGYMRDIKKLNVTFSRMHYVEAHTIMRYLQENPSESGKFYAYICKLYISVLSIYQDYQRSLGWVKFIIVSLWLGLCGISYILCVIINIQQIYWYIMYCVYGVLFYYQIVPLFVDESDIKIELFILNKSNIPEAGTFNNCYFLYRAISYMYLGKHVPPTTISRWLISIL